MDHVDDPLLSSRAPQGGLLFQSDGNDGLRALLHQGVGPHPDGVWFLLSNNDDFDVLLWFSVSRQQIGINEDWV